LLNIDYWCYEYLQLEHKFLDQLEIASPEVSWRSQLEKVYLRLTDSWDLWVLRSSICCSDS
jgi:hypothetical protein